MTYRVNKKGAIQLSTNFLVSLIIALAFFGVGMFIITTIVGKSRELCVGGVCLNDEECDKFGCLPGEDVCIDSSSKVMHKKAVTFCMTIFNKYLNTHKFKWSIDGPYRVTPEGLEPGAGLEYKMTTINDFVLIQPKKSVKKHILIKNIGAEPGTYSFNLTVKHKYNGHLSDYEKEVFFVTVP
ncbi:hypothetical protein DRJ17_01145 [Candidatus Woesearchaeota archaeon]|nr:MAG: hypothetical protein DRJ17_01145 [Candidatus Woesearchaeota archaeon]